MGKFYHPLLEWFIALCVLAFLVAVPVHAYTRLRPGAPLTYALDDAYIHMAMAKNLALSGVYGVTPDGFTSSSSSPLWTLLLAFTYRLAGVSDLAPLWLNLTAGGLALWAAWLLLGLLAPGLPGVRLAGMLALVVLLPLPALILSGMETTLQVFLTLLFAFCLIRTLKSPPGSVASWGSHGQRNELALLLAGTFFSAVRYESLALVVVGCVLLVQRRRLRLAAALTVCALLPVFGYGLYSLSQGWWFLPNSVLLKAVRPALAGQGLLIFLSRRAELLWQVDHIRVLLLASAAGFAVSLSRIGRTENAPAYRWAAALFIFAAAAQVLFGSLHWFYRYEAYVLALGITSLAGLSGAWLYALGSNWKSGWPLAALVLVGLFMLQPLWLRGRQAAMDTPGGMTNIYDQQVQMARFAREYYAGSCAAINDIGAVSYMGNVCIIDLEGLASMETARAVIDRRALKPVFETLARQKQARLVMLYESWYPGEIPAGWIKAGEWTVERSYVLGAPTVAFYATAPGEAEALRSRLREFSSSLPGSVRVTITP